MRGERWTMEDVTAYYARQGPRMASEPPSPPGETQYTGVEHEDEKSFLSRVRRLAKDNGFVCYHTHRSDHSEAGYPDVCLVKGCSLTSPGRLIFAELKSAQGKLTKEQALWLDLLRHSVPGVEVYVWRPSDWPTMCTILAPHAEEG